MPIRINLLAETQAAEEARRKDPVKRAIWIGGFLVFLVLLWSGTLQLKIIAERLSARSLDTRWKAIEARVKQAEEQARTVRDLEQKLSAIDQFTTNRVLWANALNALQNSTVDNIQIVHLKTEQTFIASEATATKANTPGAATNKAPAITERILLTLEGKDFSPRPGDQVAKLKQALATNPYFAAQLSGAEPAVTGSSAANPNPKHETRNSGTNDPAARIQLTGLSAPNTDGARTNVTFGYQLSYQEKERRLE